MDDMTAGIAQHADDRAMGVRSWEAEGVRSIFGLPYRAPDGTVIIPVARVLQAQGMGPSRAGDGRANRVTASSPLALIEVSAEGVRIKELTNSTLLGLAGITLVAWNVFWITKTVRALANKR